MGDMNAKEARLTVFASIRIMEDEVLEEDEKDPAVEMAEDKLSCYMCPKLASYGVGHLGEGAAGNNNGPSHAGVGEAIGGRLLRDEERGEGLGEGLGEGVL